MNAPPTVTVVMPTHNRGERLRTTLDALARQDAPAGSIEVVLVADGCSDGTAEVFDSWRPPFAARLIQQPASGAAAARNRGAAEARGRYLIFLDDDIRASPGLVRAHLAGHDAPRQVVIGYLPALVGGRDFFAIALRGWWDAMFQAMWKPGHRFTFRDLLSGNFSIERELFEAVGGFETRLRCHEDYELGLRLIESGASIRFAPEASGRHDERTDLARALGRKFEEGRADAWLAEHRPDLLGALPLSYYRCGSRRRRALRFLAARWTGAGDALAGLYRKRLRGYEALRLRFRWRTLLDDLFYYWYWRGVFAASPGHRIRALRMPPRAPESSPFSVDLAQGLDDAEARLDQARPAAARLYYRATFVGDIPSAPGAERLRGSHLRPLLAEYFIEPYLAALAAAGRLPPIVDPASVAATCWQPTEPRATAAGAAHGGPSPAVRSLPAGGPAAPGSTAPGP